MKPFMWVRMLYPDIFQQRPVFINDIIDQFDDHVLLSGEIVHDKTRMDIHAFRNPADGCPFDPLLYNDLIKTPEDLGFSYTILEQLLLTERSINLKAISSFVNEINYLCPQAIHMPVAKDQDVGKAGFFKYSKPQSRHPYFMVINYFTLTGHTADHRCPGCISVVPCSGRYAF